MTSTQKKKLADRAAKDVWEMLKYYPHEEVCVRPSGDVEWKRVVDNDVGYDSLENDCYAVINFDMMNNSSDPINDMSGWIYLVIGSDC